MKHLLCAIIFALAGSPGLYADYACMLEERPVCRQHRDPQNEHREKHQADCLRSPGRPVNKCPERAVFACIFEKGDITEFTYRNEDKPEAQKNCSAKGGKVERRP